MSRKRKEDELLQRQGRRKKTARNVLLLVACVGLFAGVLFAIRWYTTPQPGQDLSVELSRFNSEDITRIKSSGSNDLIVWMDYDGVARVAYNTCEDCFVSGSAYFTHSGGVLTCSSCTTSVGLSTLGSFFWGGCQPVSIPPELRADTDTHLVIPADVLTFAEGMFASWSAGDYSVSFENYPPAAALIAASATGDGAADVDNPTTAGDDGTADAAA